jgi:flagellar motor switch protein FliN
MNDKKTSGRGIPQHAPESEEFAEHEPPEDHLALEELGKVKLTLSAELGRTTMLVREVLELKRGNVVELDKLAGEMTDININGIPFAHGEVVVLGDNLHVRLAEIFGLPDRDLFNE